MVVLVVKVEAMLVVAVVLVVMVLHLLSPTQLLQRTSYIYM
jgi:hypothetical protein